MGARLFLLGRRAPLHVSVPYLWGFGFFGQPLEQVQGIFVP